MSRVVIAGGGTAGHTSPMIATAEALRRAQPEVEILCIGTPRGLEQRVIPAAGLELALVAPVPFPRRLGIDLLALPFRLNRAVRQARRWLRDFRAEAVFGVGGYAALPVYLAARREHLPVVLHEANAVPGLANKVAARFASHVIVTFAATGLPRQEVLGMPLRGAIAGLDREQTRDQARLACGLAPATEGALPRRADESPEGFQPESGEVDRAKRGSTDETAETEVAGLGSWLGHRPVLLVSGGSQGAVHLNQVVTTAIPGLLEQGVSVLHITGSKNFTAAAAPITDLATGAQYLPLAYADEMAQLYAAADLMLGRAGAATVSEVAALGLPTIFVPLPHGNGEQAKNAAELVAAGGGVLLEDAALTPSRLLAEVGRLLDDPVSWQQRTAAGPALMPRDTADRIARYLLQAAGVADAA